MLWREIAWNGARLSTPAAWEVAKIGPRYLLLADQEEPAMEIKWERVKGRFSHRTALRRLRSLHGNSVQESPLPDEWKQPLNGFIVTGFTWQAETRGGRGAILYCPACGNATLIQFFRTFSSPGNKTCLRVLASFQDHSLDDQVRWSLFDIRAQIPAEFRLVRYRFEAGRFEMHFGSKGQRIALYRWGPASALLDNGDGTWSVGIWEYSYWLDEEDVLEGDFLEVAITDPVAGVPQALDVDCHDFEIHVLFQDTDDLYKAMVFSYTD